MKPRYLFGLTMLIPMLPVVLLGFVAYWLQLYASTGYELGEATYEWICEKLGGV
jgi:hypothetical protein